jgi:hypothetical protein
MVVKFRKTIWPPPPQLSLHRRAAVSSNSDGTRSVWRLENPKSSLYCECLCSHPEIFFIHSNTAVPVAPQETVREGGIKPATALRCRMVHKLNIVTFRFISVLDKLLWTVLAVIREYWPPLAWKIPHFIFHLPPPPLPPPPSLSSPQILDLLTNDKTLRLAIPVHKSGQNIYRTFHLHLYILVLSAGWDTLVC